MGEELGDQGMNSAQRRDGGTRPAGRSKIPLLHKPGFMLPQPLRPQPPPPSA